MAFIAPEKWLRERARRQREQIAKQLQEGPHETLTPIERKRRLDQFDRSVEQHVRNRARLPVRQTETERAAVALETVAPNPPVMPTPMSQERERRRSLRDVLRRRGRASTILTREPLGGGTRLR